MSPPEQLSLVAIGNMSDHRMEDSAIQPDDPFGSLGMVDVALSFVPSMALNAALNLGIADILARHPGPLTAEEIMLEIPGCKNPHDKLAIDNLRSILAMLVLSNVFSETRSAPPRYGLTPVSKTVGVKKVSFNRELTEVKLKAWNNLHVAVLDSNAQPFVVANGHSFWEEIEKNEDLASYFHDSMRATVEMESKIIVQHYDGFDGIETLVDVGGSTGMLVSAIVQAKPHIRGINYDRPHVIASAPQLPGVESVAGDFFTSVPKGDAIIMKNILHNWTDEQCIKILENCRKSLPESGKVIICDQVLPPTSNKNLEARVGHNLNLTMLAICNGKERYAEEWANLLSAAGFPRHRIIRISVSFLDIIEAHMS